MAKLLHVPKEKKEGSYHKNLARRSSVSEEKIMQVLDFPYIVKLKDCFRTHYHSYIVMEFVPKGSLVEYVRDHKKKLGFQDLIDMMISVAKGMVFLGEEKKIVHGDLAARNLLVYNIDGRYSVKITDFGMAKEVYGGYYKASTDMPLPVRWVAPEVLSDHHFDVSSDIWSFGITCWEILTYGQIPYSWLSNKEVSLRVPNGERLPQPPNCPDALWAIILACWNENASNRTRFGALLQELEAFYLGTFGKPRTNSLGSSLTSLPQQESVLEDVARSEREYGLTPYSKAKIPATSSHDLKTEAESMSKNLGKSEESKPSVSFYASAEMK